MELLDIGAVVGAILVICEAIKRAGVRAKFIPLIAILLGIVGAFLFGGLDWANILVGIILGLGTTLGYREVKKITE